MIEDYLDISKSVMISSPAGSGKTEKLARRYIELLKHDSAVERILAITFTDKAAAEMKERILNILKKEDPDMFEKVREKMPKMRILTIHSFCSKLLKRFCLDLDIDPSFEVVDSFNADILWNEAVYESLLEDNESEKGLFYDVIKDSGIKGWSKLYATLNELHSKRPATELRTQNTEHRTQSTDFVKREPIDRILSIYSKCLNRYKRKKLKRHYLDFNDLELMAYEAISTNPEWHNILYSFDEHTDHILVDEFQDTSTLQWNIVDKLTEEWRSGQGAKKEEGITSTIFFVGDDKQSIYSFRGANVSIFKNAKKRLADWLGDEYHYIEMKENYRSLPVIVNFVNKVFESIMPADHCDDHKVKYTPFHAARDGDGAVELLLFDAKGNTKQNRKTEADLIAKRIKELSRKYEIYDSGKHRVCSYGDMAILLRGRTHLSAFEDAMRKNNIPFVVVKGMGFYNSPEVEILKSILFFLIDPMDDYSLFNILRSPLFFMDYDAIFEEFGVQNKARSERSESKGNNLKQNSLLNKWLERTKETTYATLLEEILAETGLWQYFHEKQRYVNVKKFIRLIEEFEVMGVTGLEMREKLIKAKAKSDEAKANVNTEGMDAVKIMTIHASKGLQFPMVFLPCLDERNMSKIGNIVIDESEDDIDISYEDNANIRKKIPTFQKYREKLDDEEKRLFYVAVTRAMDYLCMSGVWSTSKTKDNLKGKLAYIADAFNLTLTDEDFIFKANKAVVYHYLNSSPRLCDKQASKGKGLKAESPPLREKKLRGGGMIFTEPVDYKPLAVWLNVTEEIDEIRKKHGDDWVVLGRIFHKIFEGMSKGYISLANLEKKTTEILRNDVLSDSSIDKMKDTIFTGIDRLYSAGYLKDIILPQENSYSEIPFVLELGSRIYKGRIDRVIIKERQSSTSNMQDSKIAFIYDYKTYPIQTDEIPMLREKYSSQLDIYRKAAERLFSIEAKSFIFFTHELKIIPMK